MSFCQPLDGIVGYAEGDLKSVQIENEDYCF